MSLLKKLEEIKQAGNYAVMIYYGEDIGCDDLDVAKMKRNVKVICTPVGYLGSLRSMFVGTVKELLKFNPKDTPIIISNPPKSEEYEAHGFYVWGSEDAIKSFKEKSTGGR